jgi:hypothetical protein
MAELKTKASTASVDDFLKRVDESRREDCKTLVRIMRKATGAPPKLWGASIVGFGRYHYKYKTGREGEWFVAGFSPRKTALTVYVMPSIQQYTQLLAKLGPHKTSQSCLYIKRLADIDLTVLESIVRTAAQERAAAQA